MFAKILDILPAIAFFVVYRYSSDLILATAVIVACCLVSFGLQYTIYHTVSRMQIFLTGAVLLFGLPTVLLNDPIIIKWKVTVVNLILAGIIAFTQFGLKRNPFAWLLGKELPFPDVIWLKLSSYFMYFFIFAAALNVVIAFYLPTLFGIDAKEAESLWVDYKTFGNAILNTVFTFGCILYLMKTHPEMKVALSKMSEEKQNTARSTDSDDMQK